MPRIHARLWALGTDDVPALLAIEQQSHALPWSKTSFESSLTVKHWAYGLFSPSVSPNVARGNLQAYAVFAQGLDEWELLNVTTAPAQRGLGLAQQLLTAGASDATTAGAQRLLLEVRPSNTAALAAYHSFGFKQIALRKNYYAASAGADREDALILELNLAKYQAKQQAKQQTEQGKNR